MCCTDARNMQQGQVLQYQTHCQPSKQHGEHMKNKSLQVASQSSRRCCGCCPGSHPKSHGDHKRCHVWFHVARSGTGRMCFYWAAKQCTQTINAPSQTEQSTRTHPVITRSMLVSPTMPGNHAMDYVQFKLACKNACTHSLRDTHLKERKHEQAQHQPTCLTKTRHSRAPHAANLRQKFNRAHSAHTLATPHPHKIKTRGRSKSDPPRWPKNEPKRPPNGAATKN
jgi:hypothetical protein